MTRRKPARNFTVAVFFRVDGVAGRQDYELAARDSNDALGKAWAALHWEALDLGLVDLGKRNHAIAYRALINEALP